MATRFIRYDTDMPHNRREGVRLGIFAAVNTLARRGLLDAEQEAFRRANNDWYDANFPLPTDHMPGLYDEHQQAAAWFKAEATACLARVPGYLAILDAHGVGWRALERDDPGVVVYEDAFQVVTRHQP
jgi:hypothetical protein